MVLPQSTWCHKIYVFLTVPLQDYELPEGRHSTLFSFVSSSWSSLTICRWLGSWFYHSSRSHKAGSEPGILSSGCLVLGATGWDPGLNYVTWPTTSVCGSTESDGWGKSPGCGNRWVHHRAGEGREKKIHGEFRGCTLYFLLSQHSEKGFSSLERPPIIYKRNLQNVTLSFR